MKKNKTIALDIGGTNIKLAIIHDNKIVECSSIPSFSHEALANRLVDIEMEIMRLTDGNLEDYRGIGIALPCLVDPKEKVATEIYEKFTDITTLNFDEWSRDKFGLEVAIEQDSRVALLGEVAYGVAQGEEDVLLIIMGTGVGTAVMLNGELLSSRNNSVGSLGSHIIIEQNGRKCTCNSSGCLEAYTSGWALKEMVAEHPKYSTSALFGKTIDFYSLENAIKAGDVVADDVFSGIIKAMRAGIISLINAYDSSAVVLCGGPVNMGGMFVDPVFEQLEEMLWGKSKKIKFLTSDNPSQSVLLGLNYLCLKEVANRYEVSVQL